MSGYLELEGKRALVTGVQMGLGAAVVAPSPVKAECGA